MLTCGQVVTRGPRRRMPNPSCGGALSAESRAAPLGELPQGSGEPVTCSGLRCWRTFRPPPAARQPSRPLWGPQSGSYGVPGAERGSVRHAELCSPEERSGGGMQEWRMAGGSPVVRSSLELEAEEMFLCFWTRSWRCSFAAGGRGSERSERRPRHGLARSNLKSPEPPREPKFPAHHRAPSAITGQPAARRSSLQQRLRCTQALRDFRSLPDRRCHRGIDPRGAWIDRPRLAVRERGKALDLTEFRGPLPPASVAPRASCVHSSAAQGLSKRRPGSVS